jgi:serine O-acetyltransferase
MSLSTDALGSYVSGQLTAWFPDQRVSAQTMGPYVQRALERTEYCFSRVTVKYFERDGQPWFNHLHTDQYAMFLYFLSNTVHREDGDPSLAGKVYALNKALHAVDVFYEVVLPEVFFFQHPVGTVLGRATYGNYLAVYQRCSIGSNMEGEGPVLGDGIVLFGGSGIIGRCTVGDNAWLSVNAMVMDRDVPADSLVFGQSPHNVVKPTTRRVISRFFEAG